MSVTGPLVLWLDRRTQNISQMTLKSTFCKIMLDIHVFEPAHVESILSHRRTAKAQASLHIMCSHVPGPPYQWLGTCV